MALGVLALNTFSRPGAAETLGLDLVSLVPDPMNLNPINGVSQAFDPPNEGEPVFTLGGATRGGCEGLSASGDVQFFQPTGANRRSTLKVVLPPNLATQVFFNLRDARGQTLYQGFLPVETASHSLSIPMADLAPISEAERYDWSLAILCQSNSLRPDSPVYKGKW